MGAVARRDASSVREGERKAQEYLARLHAQQADPDELAVMLSMMYGAALRGFCEVIERALRLAGTRS